METEYKNGLTDALNIANVQPTRETIVDLMCRIKNQSRTIHSIQDRVAEIDSFMDNAIIQVECRSCGDYYHLDYAVSDFKPSMSYCGKSESCCP